MPHTADDPLRVAVLASGSGSNLQAILDACDAGRIPARVVLVASDREDAKALARGKRHGASAVFVDPAGRDRADHEAEVGDAVEAHGAELVVLAGYLRILTPAFVERFRWRVVNIHPALLPLFGGEGYYGIKVHEAALNAGVRFTGATTHFVTEDVDMGPIILQAAVRVRRDEDPWSLQQRVLEVEHEILPRTVDLFAKDRLEVVDAGAGDGAGDGGGGDGGRADLPRRRVRILPAPDGEDDTWAPDSQDVLYTDGF